MSKLQIRLPETDLEEEDIEEYLYDNPSLYYSALITWAPDDDIRSDITDAIVNEVIVENGFVTINYEWTVIALHGCTALDYEKELYGSVKGQIIGQQVLIIQYEQGEKGTYEEF